MVGGIDPRSSALIRGRKGFGEALLLCGLCVILRPLRPIAVSLAEC